MFKTRPFKTIALAAMAVLFTAGLALASVDLNTATEQQLTTLKGVGPAKAKAIIDYRQKNGGFKSVAELDKVPGFGPATVAKLQNDLNVGKGTTIPATAPNMNSKMPAPMGAANAPANAAASTPSKSAPTSNYGYGQKNAPAETTAPKNAQ